MSDPNPIARSPLIGEQIRRFAKDCADKKICPLDALAEMNKVEECMGCNRSGDTPKDAFCSERCRYIYATGLDLV